MNVVRVQGIPRPDRRWAPASRLPARDTIKVLASTSCFELPPNCQSHFPKSSHLPRYPQPQELRDKPTHLHGDTHSAHGPARRHEPVGSLAGQVTAKGVGSSATIVWTPAGHGVAHWQAQRGHGPSWWCRLRHSNGPFHAEPRSMLVPGNPALKGHLQVSYAPLQCPSGL